MNDRRWHGTLWHDDSADTDDIAQRIPNAVCYADTILA